MVKEDKKKNCVGERQNTNKERKSYNKMRTRIIRCFTLWLVFNGIFFEKGYIYENMVTNF